MSNELLKKAPHRVKVNSLALVGLPVLLGSGLVVALIFWFGTGAGTGTGTGANSSQNPFPNGSAITPAGPPNKNANLTQTSEGGQVTIKVTWQGLEAGPVFTVAMDTHSVNLDGYDLGQLAVLRTASGQEIKPLSWGGPAG